MCCESRRPRRQRRWTSLTCMDSSFLLLTRAGHPWRELFVMGQVGAGPVCNKQAHSARGRMPDAGDGVGVEEDAARPRVIRRGIDFGGAATKGAAGLRPHRRPAHGRKTQLAQGAERHGRAARREAASLLGTADRRMSKLRPGCVSAMPQGMRSRSDARRTPTSFLRTRRKARSVPGVQREKRSTPTVRPESSE